MTATRSSWSNDANGFTTAVCVAAPGVLSTEITVPIGTSWTYGWLSTDPLVTSVSLTRMSEVWLIWVSWRLPSEVGRVGDRPDQRRDRGLARPDDARDGALERVQRRARAVRVVVDRHQRERGDQQQEEVRPLPARLTVDYHDPAPEAVRAI